MRLLSFDFCFFYPNGPPRPEPLRFHMRGNLHHQGGHLVERGSGGEGAGGEEHEARQLGEFRSDDLHPWFGEGALMAPVGSGLAPRGASAIALEPTKLLSLPSGAFNEFLHALPSFLQMLQKDAAKYSQFNKLNDNLHAAAEERERQRLQAREEVE